MIDSDPGTWTTTRCLSPSPSRMIFSGAGGMLQTAPGHATDQKAHRESVAIEASPDKCQPILPFQYGLDRHQLDWLDMKAVDIEAAEAQGKFLPIHDPPINS